MKRFHDFSEERRNDFTRARQSSFVPPIAADAPEAFGMERIPEREFSDLSEIIFRHFGIHLGKNKLSLATSRIHPIMEKYGFESYQAYIAALRNDATGDLLSELANHISTNHTGFYREDAHFRLLADTVLPELTERKRRFDDRDLRIWCAACSTGEEAYTIQFCLFKHFGMEYSKWRAGLLATDLSADALNKARAGRYSTHHIQTVPVDVLATYFQRIDEETYEVIPKARKEITFRRLNLTRPEFPLRKAFDVIFCRNVMIYFDSATRLELVKKFHSWLADGGYLFIGHSESISEAAKLFRCVTPSVYAKSKG